MSKYTSYDTKYISQIRKQLNKIKVDDRVRKIFPKFKSFEDWEEENKHRIYKYGVFVPYQFTPSQFEKDRIFPLYYNVTDIRTEKGRENLKEFSDNISFIKTLNKNFRKPLKEKQSFYRTYIYEKKKEEEWEKKILNRRDSRNTIEEFLIG